jgi:hypothetical protein
MTDYHPLITRAVEGLDRSTGEARRALYERARTALVTQLRAIQPPLSESDITRERLALEDAIRKVEAEAARKSRVEPRPAAPPPPRPAAPPPPLRRERVNPPPADAARDTGAPSARDRLLGARPPSLSEEGIRSLRNVVGEAPGKGFTRDDHESDAPTSSPHFQPDEEADEAAASWQGAESQFEDSSAAHDEWPTHDRAGGYESDEEVRPHAARHAAHAEVERPRPPRSYRGLIQLLVALIIVGGVAATISWQWSHIAGLYHSVAQIGSKPPAQTSRETATERKFSDRAPQEQSGTGQPSGAATPGGQAVPAVAQRVVLYEEDSNDPQGKRYAGSAIWRTETVSPGPGQPPELVVRADVTIPERRLSMTWSLRRNTDTALPASHTIEIMFTLPSDFAGGGIANVPGVLMKQSEQTRGTPLAGLAVKVTNGFFLIGLSSVESDVQRNLQLLKERPWFDIPIVYTNGGRAILAMEKGPPGDRAFADAFAAWEKK